MPIDPNHPSPADFRLGVDVLVAMEQNLGLLPADVLRKGFKACMDLVLLVMNPSGRVVRDEDINMREVLEKGGGLILFIEKVASGFVLPRAVESPKGHPNVVLGKQVEIHNGHGKGNWRIMVALHG